MGPISGGPGKAVETDPPDVVQPTNFRHLTWRRNATDVPTMFL